MCQIGNSEDTPSNVSVFQIKQKILNQEESADNDREKVLRPCKSASSAIISNLAKNLKQEEKEEVVKLRKAPKFITEN